MTILNDAKIEWRNAALATSAGLAVLGFGTLADAKGLVCIPPPKHHAAHHAVHRVVRHPVVQQVMAPPPPEEAAPPPPPPPPPAPEAAAAAPQITLNALVVPIDQLGIKLGPHQALPANDDYGCIVVWHGPFTSKCKDIRTETSGSYPVTIGINDSGTVMAYVQGGVVAFDYQAYYHSGEGWLHDINGTISALAQVAGVAIQGEQVALIAKQINQQTNFNSQIIGGINGGKFASLFGTINCGIVENLNTGAGNNSAGPSNGTCVVASNTPGAAIGGENAASNAGSTFGGNVKILSPKGPGG